MNRTLEVDKPSGATSEGHRVLWMWWDEGVLLNAHYMLVVLDKRSGSIYPVYTGRKEFDEMVYMHNGIFGQHIMEIYDLSKGRLAQLAERRAWNVPK